MSEAMGGLLGPGEIRQLARTLGLRPTKTLGQNFVHDANTVRRIVETSRVGAADHVLEVGPGLGSLTVGLAQVAGSVTAVEIDSRLSAALPSTLAAHLGPDGSARVRVIGADALKLAAGDVAELPTAVVANLPYNVGVPVILHLLAEFPSIASMLVMVQAEVADRLVAGPGSRTYGVPSVKLAWYGTARRAGSVSRSVFWPVPGVDSALVAFTRSARAVAPAPSADVFAVVDAAFAQRRKTLRSALASWAGSAALAETVCRAAGVDPSARGESLPVDAFAALATEHRRQAAAAGEASSKNDGQPA